MRIAAPLIGLLYPALVWAIHGVSPFSLILTLLAPGVCLYLAFRLADGNHYRHATIIAYFAVGAPALYTFLGGWLDSGRWFSWLPFRGNGVWVVLWSALLILTIAERSKESQSTSEHSRRLAFAHGVSAAVITTFALFHLTNHLSAVFGGQAHIKVMQHLRLVYRQPAIELLLGASILFQVTSGLVLLLRRMRRSGVGWMEVLQNASGTYLLLFFASHISAVLRARYLQHIDTNWIWLTADNLLTDAWSVRLVPYYFLAVLALAVHGGCGLRWVLLQRGQPKIAERIFLPTVTAGGLAALTIVITMVLASLHG